jgi:regulator of protease activity HflC (stomatin/prohibitin superfamily)
MNTNVNTNVRQPVYEEISPRHRKGMAVLLLNLLALLVSLALIIIGAYFLEDDEALLGAPMIIVGVVYLIFGCIFFGGLKVLKPNEALVLTLFGKYIGTLKTEGFYYVNPFATAVNPAKPIPGQTGKISLKTQTLNNEKQKVNDQLGNPIEIGIVVIWRVVNPTMAAFNVENYRDYLSIQCDSALRNIVREYPYDTSGDGDDEKTLRGGTIEIAEKLAWQIQEKTKMAGLEVIEARITHLSYAPEIAAAMLQRQQAAAIIDARQMIVEGAVGMVEMALERLNERNIVNLDDERKAAMVSNLLVVLCGNKDAQPIVNSGSLY